MRLPTVARALVLTLAAAPFANIASAADLNRGPPPQWEPPRFSRPALWDGLYFGGHLGGVIPEIAIKSLGSANVTDSGLSGGVHAGYNYSFGSWVAGMEFDATWTGADGSKPFGGASAGASLDFMASARARLGYAWDNWLVYGTAGFAAASIDARTTVGGVSSSNDDWQYGWVAGGGVGYKVHPRMSVRVEALYYDFGSDTKSFATGTSKVDADATEVRAGLTFHFN